MMDDIKNLQKFPAVISGIYFLYKDFKLVYIGRTENLFQRIGTHIHGDKDFDSFSFLEVNPNDIEKAEFDFIEFFEPPLNLARPVKRVGDDEFDRVSEWIKRIPRGKLTFSDFAKKVEIPQPLFSHYLHCRVRPRADHFDAVERLLKNMGV